MSSARFAFGAHGTEGARGEVLGDVSGAVLGILWPGFGQSRRAVMMEAIITTPTCGPIDERLA